MHAVSRDDEGVGDVVSTALEGVTEDVLVVNPTTATVRALLDELGTMDAPPAVRLFADAGLLKDLVDDFLVSSAIADLTTDGVLSIRTLETTPRNSLLVSPDAVTAVVDGGETVAGLSAADAGLVDDTYDHYDASWQSAPEFTLRTPPLSQVRTTLEAEIGPDAAADFDAALDALDAARGNGDGLDEVTVSLVVAARNDVLLYDVSKWGEDVGLASKATFSRTKTNLEEAGVIDTDKVPIDVGRPRLRLKLGDDDLVDLSVAELIVRVQDRVAAEA